MRLNDLESFVEVLLHGLVVDQVLLELLCQLCAQHLQVLNLLRCFAPNLEDLLIDVATEEVSSFSGVLLCLFDFFKDLADLTILTFFNRSYLIHHVSKQVLYKQLCLFITVHALVNLNPNHLAQLIGNLNLIVFEAIDLVADRVVNLGDFGTQVNFLLRPSHFFLTDPSVDTTNLCLKVRINRLD